MTRLQGIPAARIKGLWPAVLPFIERALAYDSGRYTAQSIRKGLLDRAMQLTVVEDVDDGARVLAICITEIRNYPAKKVGTIFLCAGHDMSRWLHHLPEIEAWLKQKGCREVELYGRPGWAKALPEYTFARVLLRKEL